MSEKRFIYGQMILRKITRCWRAAESVHQITNENRVLLFCEVVINWLYFGASDEDYLTMEFYRKNFREKKRWLTSKKNNRYLYKTVYSSEAIETFDNKVAFDKCFKHLMRHETLAIQDNSEDCIRHFITRFGEVVVKPARGACGVGVYKIIDGDENAIKELLKSKKSGKSLICEQVIEQHPEMARMNPSSVNTIRVITMVDRKGEIQIINTCVKFGGSEKCISNTMGGGFCCHVDAETGIIDGLGHTIKGERYFRHPVSKVIIPGFQIPCWKGVCDYAKQLAKVMPSGRYIGWDIVVLKDRYDVIEGNIHPGQDFQACDGVGRWKQIKSLI